MSGYIIIEENPDADQPFHVIIKSENHETVFHGENYENQRDAYGAILFLANLFGVTTAIREDAVHTADGIVEIKKRVKDD
jgi:hypothetical protein